MKKKICSHEDLVVWQKSVELVKTTYSVVKTFPDDEKYGLISQMKRASVSVASNIAEGAGRKSYKEFCFFLNVAMGSLSELDTQYYLSQELGFLKSVFEIRSEIKRIRIMLSSLRKRLYERGGGE